MSRGFEDRLQSRFAICVELHTYDVAPLAVIIVSFSQDGHCRPRSLKEWIGYEFFGPVKWQPVDIGSEVGIEKTLDRRTHYPDLPPFRKQETLDLIAHPSVAAP